MNIIIAYLYGKSIIFIIWFQDELYWIPIICILQCIYCLVFPVFQTFNDQTGVPTQFQFLSFLKVL